MKRKTKEEVAIAHNKMICEIDKITRDFSKNQSVYIDHLEKKNLKLKALLDLAMGTIEFYGDFGTYVSGGHVFNDTIVNDLGDDSYSGNRARETREKILKQLGEI